MNRYNWLHISDFHEGQDRQIPLWPNVREAFYTDLRSLIAKIGPINLILFSGDVAFSGKKEQFERINDQLIDPLLEWLEKESGTQPTILSVPGNHDIIRSSSKHPKAALRQLTRPDGYSEIMDEFWNDELCDYREYVNDVHVSYTSWWNTLKNKQNVVINSGIIPGDFSCKLTTKLNCGELKIGVVGLNSTFLQLSAGDYHRKLALDPRQISAVCNDDVPGWINSHDINILMTHQGPDWLLPKVLANVYPEINPAGRFDIHVFGHAHESVMQSVSHGAGPVIRQWQSTSLFGLEKYSDELNLVRKHGYSVGSFECVEGGLTLRHWPREANFGPNGWRMQRSSSAVLEESDGGTIAELLPRNLALTKPELSKKSNRKPVASSKVELKWLYSKNDFRDYCQAILNRFGKIRFVEIPDLQDIADVAIDVLFVEPNIGKSEGKETFSDDSLEHRSLVEILDTEDSVLLLGDPGCGKSTLISSVCSQLCSKTPSPNSAFAQKYYGYVPVPIVLRELDIRSDVTWEDLIKAFMKHNLGSVLGSQVLLEHALKQGNAIVMFDGLDEIGNITVRNGLRNAIHDGMRLYPKVKWVMTSRVIGYGKVPFHEYARNEKRSRGGRKATTGKVAKKPPVERPAAAVYYIQQFTDGQIARFAANWYSHHELNVQVVDEMSTQFVQELRENEGTRRMSRVPYLLTLMALIYHKNTKLPSGRVELYEKIATAYLDSIDLRRGIDGVPYSLNQKRGWISVVAFNMQLRRDRSADGGAREVLASSLDVKKWLLQAMQESSTGATVEEVQRLLDFFSLRSGLLVPKGGEDQYAFSHLSMQEYFAAVYISNKIVRIKFEREVVNSPVTHESIIGWSRKESWVECFLILSELVASRSIAETEAYLDFLFSDVNEMFLVKGNKAAAVVALMAEIAADVFIQIPVARRLRMEEVCWRVVMLGGLSDNDSIRLKVTRTLLRRNSGNLKLSWAFFKAEELERVKSLDLRGCPYVADLSEIVRLTNLRILRLSGCRQVVSLKPLRACPRLRELSIDGCRSDLDLDVLRYCAELRSVVLGSVRNVDVLNRLRHLESVHFHDSMDLPIDLGFLEGLSQLHHICNLGGNELIWVGKEPSSNRVIRGALEERRTFGKSNMRPFFRKK